MTAAEADLTAAAVEKRLAPRSEAIDRRLAAMSERIDQRFAVIVGIRAAYLSSLA